MALIVCKDCSNQISKSAKECPSCGAPNTVQAQHAAIGCLFFFLLFVGCTTWLAVKVANFEPPPWNETDNSSMAYLMIEDFVTNRLISPSTASFAGIFEIPDHVKRLEDNRYYIKSYVDSQNEHGATIRKRFEGIIKQVGQDEWNLESLKFHE